MLMLIGGLVIILMYTYTHTGIEGQLYDLDELTKRVAAVAALAPEATLLEAQAHLHELAGRFEAALVVYWDLHRLLGTSGGPRRFEPVFRLIEEHSLFEAAQDRALTLVRMDQVRGGKRSLPHVCGAWKDES